MRAERINLWVAVIGGFTQETGEANGLNRLWKRLGKFRSPSVCITPHAWNDRWGNLAELIFTANNGDPPPRVVIAGYSYGGGKGAPRLCNELRRRGVNVSQLVLSDPVCTPALWRSYPILIPDNVRVVHSYFQRSRRSLFGWSDWVQGHPVIPEDRRRTVVHQFQLMRLTHTYMDDSQRFHDAVERAVAGELSCKN